MPSPPSILFGLADHLHPCWASLYPEGLPHDWRLAWYANEFRALLVPDAHWMQPAELRAWVQDTHEIFYWYLNCPELTEAHLAALQSIRSRLSPETWQRFNLVYQSTAKQEMADQLAGVGIHYFGPIDNGPYSWSHDLDAFMDNPDCLGFMLQGDSSLSLRQLRHILQSQDERARPEQPGFLFLQPGPRGMENLHQCQELLALLGLAY
jgi:hypothetical protein